MKKILATLALISCGAVWAGELYQVPVVLAEGVTLFMDADYGADGSKLVVCIERDNIKTLECISELGDLRGVVQIPYSVNGKGV